MTVPVASPRLVDRYLLAKEMLIQRGYAHEITWQDNVAFSSVTEQDFLREAAWVVLSSGMREVVIRKVFPEISAAFFGWESARRIAREKRKCRRLALGRFGNQRKIDSIIRIAEIVDAEGFDRIKVRISEQGPEALQALPHIGPTTCFHLAKNIGLDVSKPDRHLRRVASVAGFESPATMCEALAREVGDRKAVVDIVIWRFATIYSEYTDYFCEKPVR